MKSLCLLILTCTISLSFAQKPDKRIHLKHTIKEEQQQIQFFVLDNEESALNHYDKSKMYFWFKAQKILSTQGGASGQLLHGELEGFYANKQLSKKGNFYKGLKDGLWLYWNENGILIAQEFWRNGVKSGYEKHFNEQGKITESIRYKGNKSQRQTKDSLIYDNPSKQKKVIYLLDENGLRKSKISLRKNVLHGEQSTYEDGKILKSECYENGKIITKKSLKERFKGVNKKEKSEDKTAKKAKDKKTKDPKKSSGTEKKKTTSTTEKKSKEGGLFKKKKKVS